MKELNPPAVVKEIDSLEELASQINGFHVAGETARAKGLKFYRECGEMLLKAKEKCGHGQWLKWLKEHVRFSEGRVRHYMQLAKSIVTIDLEQAENEWQRISGNAETESSESNGVYVPCDSTTEYETSCDGEDNDAVNPVTPDDETSYPDTGRSSPVPTPSSNGHSSATDVEEIKDAEGIVVPERCKPAFHATKTIGSICHNIDKTLKQIQEIAAGPGGRLLRFESIKQQLKDVRGALWANRATHICPYCEGEIQKKKACECCKDDGWVSHHIWKQAPGNDKKAKRPSV